MCVLVVFCLPGNTSYKAALQQEVLTGTHSASHDLNRCDFYFENLNLVSSRFERFGYHDVPRIRLPVHGYADRPLRAEGPGFGVPAWCPDTPAMLRGLVDRKVMPGAAFKAKLGRAMLQFS